MSSSYHLLIQSLLTRAHPENAKNFLPYFSVEDESILNSTRASKKLPNLQISEALSNIHYSWIPPALVQYPTNLKNFIVSSLPSSLSEGVMRLIKPPIQKTNLSPFAKKFFLSLFYKDWAPGDLLYTEFLEVNPLNGLLSLSKLQLVSLVDFLGIQDLSIDLRKIVDKKVLDSLKKSLSAHQKQYLDYCLRRADIPVVKAETIHYWMQDMSKLPLLIHQKGLGRLAYALLGQNSHLIWHITHRLDIGRGKELSKLLSSMPSASQKLIAQICSEVLDLMKLLNKGKI